jgi:hypothetical protein
MVFLRLTDVVGMDDVAEHLEDGIGCGDDAVGSTRCLLGVEEPSARGPRLEDELAVLDRVLHHVRAQRFENR